MLENIIRNHVNTSISELPPSQAVCPDCCGDGDGEYPSWDAYNRCQGDGCVPIDHLSTSVFREFVKIVLGL